MILFSRTHDSAVFSDDMFDDDTGVEAGLDDMAQPNPVERDSVRDGFKLPKQAAAKKLGKNPGKDDDGKLTLAQLISLQNAQGGYKWGQAFEKIGLDKKEVKGAKPKHKVVTMDVWLAAIALKIMEKVLQDEQDSWKLLAKKIRSFIQDKVGKELLKDVVEGAAVVVQNAIDLKKK